MAFFILPAIFSLLGVGACVFHRRLSGWLWIVALGFAGIAASSAFVLYVTATSASFPPRTLTAMTYESDLSFLLGAFSYSFVVVVGGFAGLLTGIRDKFLRLQRNLTLGDGTGPTHLPDAADLRPFREGQGERHDIQR